MKNFESNLSEPVVYLKLVDIAQNEIQISKLKFYILLKVGEFHARLLIDFFVDMTFML